jgi:hypothetical protein
VADEIDAGPIVLGARGLGRIESKLLGSVSIAVVFHATRPVLVVPHHEADQPPPVTGQQAPAGERREKFAGEE